MNFDFREIGLTEYPEAYALQKETWEDVFDEKTAGRVIITEHNHCFTLGRSAEYSNILIDSQRIKSENIKVYRTERGGDITYHGPGQLIAYPVFNLKLHKQDVRAYVEDLEEVVINFLQLVGVQGFRRDGYHGVWTDKGKIASLGVAIKKWISFHGLAINIDSDQKFFSYIKPCGLDSREIISLREFLGSDLDSYNFVKILKESFKKVFKWEE